MEGFTLEERRKTIELYWRANQAMGKGAIVKHFVSLGGPEKVFTGPWASWNFGKICRGSQEMEGRLYSHLLLPGRGLIGSHVTGMGC